MNLLFLTLMYPDDLVETAAKNSRDGLQMQIDGYQRAFIEGLRQNLNTDETLSIVNSLPVGVFPIKYKKPIIKGFARADGSRELGSINLPYIKQKQRERGALKAILKWAALNAKNRTVLLYTLYLPYMRAVAAAKRQYPDLRAAVIVTDLPNELGIASGRRGLLKKAEYIMGDERFSLCSAFDGFVLLTASMADPLKLTEGQKRVVIEGLIQKDEERPRAELPKRFTVLYTGTLNRELGVGELIEAFETMPEYELWLCGTGDMIDEAQQASKRCENIKCFGFVPHDEALQMQSKASVLVNPRTSGGVYTLYSFPSKTLEYLRAGKPVLCRKLDGIPDEYDEYLCYIRDDGAEGIRRAVKELAGLVPNELNLRGEKGRRFALEKKNPIAQTARAVDMLRELTGASGKSE